MAVGQNITVTPEQRLAALEGADGLQETATHAADGAITIKNGKAIISKGSAAAITLAAPTTGTDDGKVLRIEAATTFAHVVTVTGMIGGSTLTFATNSDHAILRAVKGSWQIMQTKNVTVA